ncbi:aldehyde reductase [Nocardia sp. CDC159]|uniref:Aldehyde reductase n=1 Tax=Nocardia pulmonis TaxID=2951408 RepID=A0A9X2EAX9_9NOCA|nr:MULTISPECIES: aldehyde reductase [Nocardia]MCM6776013.1 aldehyde reductase [Nocardia pulmonis]MCM6788660.1 aldehyde reductase [Nocardia sp. CDC159]
MTDETVLVTGGTGFLATRCIAQALNEGYRVRTTARNNDAAQRIREQVAAAGAANAPAVEVAAADLTADAGWAEAAAGCTHVLHVASPFPAAQPEDEDEVIVPARDGTLRVLRAARDAGVRRVVVTSAFGACGYGHKETKRPFTEEDWTNLDDPTLPPTVKAKTLAERAAWDFLAREGGGLELSVVNPVGIFGPVLGPEFSNSISVLLKLLDGTAPAIVPLSFAVVDVRDVAELHLRAMTHPAAAGQRFIASAGDVIEMGAVAKLLRDQLGPDADRVPTKQLPMWVVKAAAKMAPGASELAGNLGKVRHVSNAKAREILGWTPRSTEDTLLVTARSLLEQGLVGTPAIMG